MYGFRIPTPPSAFDGSAVLLRLLDGLAFRYFWATEGLRASDFEFRPAPDCMSALELQRHILQLVFMIQQTVGDHATREQFASQEPAAVRAKTLAQLELVRSELESLGDDALAEHRVLKRDGSFFPVWNILNGPLADAFTHIGQLNSWRRLNGNPPPRANVFEGVPPGDDPRA